MLFTIEADKLNEVSEELLKLEKDLQKLTENNLDAIFGFQLVCTEYQLGGFRLDTLAFNQETNSFVILEYKKDRNFSVIDQGYSYLSLLLNNKADFVLEYNRQMPTNRQKEDFDWSQTKVIFLANSFTNYQHNAINFRDLPIELWEVKQYDNKTISYEKMISSAAKDSIKTVTRNPEITKVQQEVRSYTVDELIAKTWETTRSLYDELRDKLLELDPAIEETPTKYYIGFKIGKRNFITIEPRKTFLQVDFIRIRPSDVKDPDKMLKYRDKSFEQWHVHISRATVKSSEEISYAIYLAQQLHGKFFK